MAQFIFGRFSQLRTEIYNITLTAQLAEHWTRNILTVLLYFIVIVVVFTHCNETQTKNVND